MARFTGFTDFLQRLVGGSRSLAAALILNLALFIVVRLSLLHSPALLSLLELPGSLGAVIHRPWTLVSYGFVQVDFWHLFVNLLLLLFFGKRLGSLRGAVDFWLLYMVGSVCGALLFVLLSGGGVLIGASAAVMSLAMASATASPRHRVALLPGLDVRLIWLALALVLVDLIALTAPDATARVAHLGGAAAGCLTALILLRGRRRMRPVVPARQNKSADLDVILRKLQTSGHDSLTEEEKRRLFNLTEHRRNNH